MTDSRLPRRTREDLQLRAIREILRASAAALPLDEILSVIANMTIIVFDASTSWFMLSEDGRLRTAIARGELADDLAGKECVANDSGSCVAAVGDKPIILQPQDIDSADPVLGVFAREPEPVILLPLRVGGRALGILGSAVTPEATLDISFLVTVAEQASSAVERAHLREESRGWQERLDAVFEGMAEQVLVFGANGKFALMNASAALLLNEKGVQLGDTIDELTGKAGLTTEGRPLAGEEMPAAKALRGERVECLELELAAAGVSRHFLASAVPLFADRSDGLLVRGAVVVLRDVTEHRQAAAERERLLEELEVANGRLVASGLEARALADEAERQTLQLSALLTNLGEGVTILDGEGRMVLRNEAQRKITGLTDSEAHSSGAYPLAFLRLDGTPGSPETSPVRKLLQSGEPFTDFEFIQRRPDGTSCRIVSSGSAVRDEWGKVALAIVISRDVTEVRRLEQMRQEYISLISHDLRSPLTSIMGMAQMLHRSLELEGKENSRDARVAEALVKNTRRMEGMIRDLVESARLESGQLDLHNETTDLLHLVFDLVERIGTPEDRGRIHVDVVDHVPPLLADPLRLERAIINVLTNALKYSPPDKRVVIILQRRDGRALISVADEGVGIPPEDLPHLFQRNFRAKTAGQREGLGLGLYITRLIVEAHGGQVYAESAVGKGSTFHLSLPLA